MRNSFTIADNRDYAIAKGAQAEIECLIKGDFVQWARHCDMSDPLISELFDRYYADFKQAMHTHYTTLMKTILRCAKRHKVRFLSISRFDLITFEDIHYPTYMRGWPVAWHIARVCGIDHGAGNSNQHQINLQFLPSYHFGTYDLRDKHPMLVGDFVVSNRHWDYVKHRYNKHDSVASYLRTCNIAPYEPARTPYFGADFPSDSRWNVRMDGPLE